MKWVLKRYRRAYHEFPAPFDLKVPVLVCVLVFDTEEEAMNAWSKCKCEYEIVKMFEGVEYHYYWTPPQKVSDEEAEKLVESTKWII